MKNHGSSPLPLLSLGLARAVPRKGVSLWKVGLNAQKSQDGWVAGGASTMRYNGPVQGDSTLHRNVPVVKFSKVNSGGFKSFPS